MTKKLPKFAKILTFGKM